MPNKPPEDQPRRPIETVASVNFRISDTEPFLKFLEGLEVLYGKMAGGQLTIEEATDALGRVLLAFEGETL